MQITPVAQDSTAAKAAPVVPKQETQPIQAPEQQKPQAPQKDSVVLSQAAKDLSAQVPVKAAPEEAKAPPAVAVPKGLTAVDK